MSNQTYNRTQTVQIATLSINGEDLRPFLVAFNIYEDIFSNFLTCDLTLLEDQSLTEQLPLFGGESIVISFNSHAADGDFDTITKVFICTGIENLEVDPRELGQKGRTYTIKGISVPGFINLQKRINRPYKNQKECDIVRDISKQILGIDQLRVEPCRYERNSIVFPSVRPSEAITMMARSAVRSGTDRVCDYVFYEDMDKFNFVPLDFLVKQSKTGIITNRVTRHETNKKYARLNAENFHNSKNFDLIENMHRGMYGSTAYHVNLDRKIHDKKVYLYPNQFKEQADIDGSNDMLMNNPPSFERQTISLHSEEQDSYSNQSKIWHGVRRKMFQQFKNNKYIIEVDGDTTIKVGDIVQFDLPSFDVKTDSEKKAGQVLDKFLSGHYLILHLRHYVTKKEHRMILTLAKNKRKQA